MNTKKIVLLGALCLAYLALVAGGTALMQSMSVNATNCTEIKP